MPPAHPDPRALLDALREARLLTPAEHAAARAAVGPLSPFAQQVSCADAVHLHLKVDDTAAARASLPGDWATKTDRSGFLALAVGPRVDLSLSSVAVTEDDLAQPRRPRPFLDHIGFDLPETVPARAAFGAVPATARSHAWSHAAQGQDGRPVCCCHARVRAKHWVFPPNAQPGPRIPIEFSLGEIEDDCDALGADLRPAAPATRDP